MATKQVRSTRTTKAAPAVALKPASWEKFYAGVQSYLDGKASLSKALATALKGAKYDDVVHCVAKYHGVPVKASTHPKVVQAGGSVTLDRDHANAESARKDVTDVLNVLSGGKTRSEKQSERKAANTVVDWKKVVKQYESLDAKGRAAFRKELGLSVK